MTDKTRYPFFRLTIARQSGSDNIHADMPSWNPITGEQLDISPEEMKSHIDTLLSVLDDRSYIAQKRMLAAYGLTKYLPLEYQQMVLEIIECLTGQADPAYTIKRWEAIAEENRALEEGRLAAMEQALSNGEQHD